MPEVSSTGHTPGAGVADPPVVAVLFRSGSDTDSFLARAATAAGVQSQRKAGRVQTLGKLDQALKQKLVSQKPDGPKLASEIKPAPQSRLHREWLAIKETFFNTNSLSLLLINFFLAFVPLGLASGVLGWGCLSVFGLNFLAIIPLSAVLGAATESMSRHTGQVLGGLLNATLGNAVEMAVTFFAVKGGMVEIVQMSLIGSLLSNLLLVLGMSFIASGIKNHESHFNASGAGATMTCLVLASLALTLPTVYRTLPGTTPEEVVHLSRIIAGIMAFVYVCFIYFQLSTHAELFEGTPELRTSVGGEGKDGHGSREGTGPLWLSREASGIREATQELPTVPESQAIEVIPSPESQHDGVSLLTSSLILLFSTVAVMVCSEYLVASIHSVSSEYKMPYAFIGLILLPIVGNAAEHTTAVTAAYHDLMDLSLSVAIGSSTQVALLVIPYSVIVGWIYGVPVGLDFHVFSTTVFVLSVLIANGVLSDGSGNWFEGLMLVSTYMIVAIIAWFIPDAGMGPITDVREIAVTMAAEISPRSLMAVAPTWLSI